MNVFVAAGIASILMLILGYGKNWGMGTQFCVACLIAFPLCLIPIFDL
jgi:hypothetical protein